MVASAYQAGDLALRGAQAEQGTDHQVHAHGCVPRLHLGYAGLARAELAGELCLGETLAAPPTPDALRKSELGLDKCLLLVVQAEEFRRIADLPAGGLESGPLVALRRFSFAASRYRCKRRWQLSRTTVGVLFVFLLNTSRMTTASDAR